MGLFSKLRPGGKIIDLADKGLNIAKEAVIDKDKQIELTSTLNKLRTELLLSGKGGSITKFTINFLVASLVLTALAKFWFTPVDLPLFKDLALSVTPLLGILIGVFGGGSMFKNSKWSSK